MDFIRELKVNYIGFSPHFKHGVGSAHYQMWTARFTFPRPSTSSDHSDKFFIFYLGEANLLVTKVCPFCMSDQSKEARLQCYLGTVVSVEGQ